LFGFYIGDIGVVLPPRSVQPSYKGSGPEGFQAEPSKGDKNTTAGKDFRPTCTTPHFKFKVVAKLSKISKGMRLK
jgi:hypothetical protein